jgi:hypothetical protein
VHELKQATVGSDRQSHEDPIKRVFLAEFDKIRDRADGPRDTGSNAALAIVIDPENFNAGAPFLEMSRKPVRQWAGPDDCDALPDKASRL